MRMRIRRITLHLVELELKRPFLTNMVARFERHILVEMETDEGTGWGECSAPREPFYTGETDRSTWRALADWFMAPRIIGSEITTIDAFNHGFAPIKGDYFARAGLEMAAWDLIGRAQGRSLSSLLGGTRASIDAGVVVGMDLHTERLLETVEEYLGKGYRKVKLKIQRGMDREPVEAVRARFPDVPLMLDANSSYTVEDAATLEALDAHDLVAIEQPVGARDLVGHAALQKKLRTRIGLDESIATVDDLRTAVALGACRAVNVKGPRVGGLCHARAIAEQAARDGIAVWSGGMHEYGIGRAAAVALAAHPAFNLTADLSDSDKYYAEDLVDPPIVVREGKLEVPTGPGLGVTVDEARVKKHTVEKLVLK
jgi:O-succinylbenzoate synthase